MSFSYGRNIRLTLFGASHGPALGVALDGVKAGFKINFDKLKLDMDRRKAWGKTYASKRREPDDVEIISGLRNGFTDGSPLTIIIKNIDTRSADYEELKYIPRPMHADYPAMIKYGQAYDPHGGSFFSGRMTAPLVAAGSILRQFLCEKGIEVAGHISSIKDIKDQDFSDCSLDEEVLRRLGISDFPLINESKKDLMQKIIVDAREKKDSVGGSVECCILGLPTGLGSPIFKGLDSLIASIVFAIPGSKAIEFGQGFSSIEQFGSQYNDSYIMKDGRVQTRTNRHGGVLGGLATGMPLIFKVAFKPTSSIGLKQDSVNIQTGESAQIQIEGRHDPCIVPRAVVCVEAAAIIAIADEMKCEGLI